MEFQKSSSKKLKIKTIKYDVIQTLSYETNRSLQVIITEANPL